MEDAEKIETNRESEVSAPNKHTERCRERKSMRVQAPFLFSMAFIRANSEMLLRICLVAQQVDLRFVFRLQLQFRRDLQESNACSFRFHYVRFFFIRPYALRSDRNRKDV